MKRDTIKALTLDIESDKWDGGRGFVMRDVPMPIIDEKRNPDDALSVILKIRYAGVCGSDKGLWYRSSFKEMVHDSLGREKKGMRITGHEFFGEVVEAGSMVKSLYCDPDARKRMRLEVGSHVSGDSHITCGKCYQCRLGEEHVCMNESILGISTDGIFAEYVKIPAKNLWTVDGAHVRPEIAAILDPFGNAVHATSKVDFRGQRVAIFGVGSIGQFSILLLKNFGASQIIAVDVNAANLAAAKELGAHEIVLIDPKYRKHEWDSDSEVIRRIMEITHDKGVDVSMEMAGPPSSLNNCIDSTRRGGHVILFGIKDGDFMIPNFSRTIMRGLTLHAVIGRQIFKTWQVSQRMLANTSNGIQDAIWEIMLKKGKGTILDFMSFTPESFEKALGEHSKVMFRING